MSAVSDYLKDPSVSQHDRGLPWQDILPNAGVPLPETTHFKPTRKAPVNEITLWRTAAKEGLGNFILEEEKALNISTTYSRVRWINIQLYSRPIIEV